jgi:hypothetical protein
MRELLHELNCKKDKMRFSVESELRHAINPLGLIMEFSSMRFYSFSIRPDNVISSGLCSPVASCWNFFLAFSIIAALVLSLKNQWIQARH